MAFFPVQRSAFPLTKNFPALAGILLAGAALLAGCHPAVTDPNDPKYVVAEKGDWTITRGELDSEVNNYLKQHQATPEQLGKAKMPLMETAMLKNMVLKKVLLAKAAALPPKDTTKEEATDFDAVKSHVPPGQDFATVLKEGGMTVDDLKQKIHEKVLIGQLLQAEAFKNLDPTDQEIDDVYMKNKESFTIPEKIRASRILILVDDKTTPADKATKKKAIDKARDRVVKGEDFGKVSSEVSEDQYSKTRGGDMGFFPKNENEPGFDDVAFNAKENTISPVFETALGYQFIKVTAIQPAGPVPLADARAYISSKLREMKMEQQEQDYAKKVLADSGVTYHLTLVDTAPPEAAGTPGAQSAPAGPSDNSAAPAASNAPDSSSSAQPAPAPAEQAAPAGPPADTSSTNK
jgi:hypothetical protein